MDVVVYGKPGCELCSAAKDKLERMEVPFNSVNLEAHGDDWRVSGVIEAYSYYMLWDTLPVISIDGEFMKYPDAMRLLKRGARGG